MSNTKEDEEVVRRSRQIKDVGRRRLLKVLGVLFVICLSSLVGGGLASYLSVRDTAVDGTVLAQQIQKACDSSSITSPDLAQFCPKADQVVEAAPSAVKADPVPGPPGPSGSPGASGDNGNDGIDGTNGTNGKNGKNGKSVVGPSGPAGQNGANGKDAVITLAMITSAFEAYCEDTSICTGPKGDKGEKGEKGDTGEKGNTGDVGPQGPPGDSVRILDACDPAPDGQYVSDVNTDTSPDNLTVTITCTYRDDQTGAILGQGDMSR